MKKTFLSMLLIGSSCALFAQVEQTRTDTVPTPTQPTTTQPTMDDKTTLSSTGQYSAYSAVVTVPPSIQTQFTAANPSATDVRWEQNNQWYRATYKVGAHRMRMMYDMRGNSWALALPVTNGLIPDEVIEKAYTLYGDNVYDISRLKTAPKAVTMSSDTMSTTAPTTGDTTAMNADVSGNTMTTSTMNMGGDIYQVRIIENGVLRTERMNEDGTPYTEAYWRVDSVDMNQQNLQQQNMDQQNMNTTDSLQQTAPTTDTSGTGVNDGTMNNNTTDDNQNTTDNTNTPEPSAPTDNPENSDATLPNSDPKLEK